MAVQIGNAGLNIQNRGDGVERILTRAAFVIDVSFRKILVIARAAADVAGFANRFFFDAIEAIDTGLDQRSRQEGDQPARESKSFWICRCDKQRSTSRSAQHVLRISGSQTAKTVSNEQPAMIELAHGVIYIASPCFKRRCLPILLLHALNSGQILFDNGLPVSRAAVSTARNDQDVCLPHSVPLLKENGLDVRLRGSVRRPGRVARLIGD